MSGTITEERKRQLILQHEITHALHGLLKLYDVFREIEEDSSCNEMWDMVNDGAVDVFNTFIWETARNEAIRLEKFKREWSETRMEPLLRRIEQITGDPDSSEHPSWQVGDNVSLIDEILPLRQEAMNFGLQVMRGTYAGWSAEKLRPHLMAHSLGMLAPDAEKFVH